MDSYTLKSVSDLPAPFRSTFSFRYFNSLQSECFPICFYSDINMVISAPTGSGKTVLFELCILRLLSRSISEEGRFIHTKGTLKTIYIAPSKALVQEKLRDWNQKFGSLGVNTLELTGDNEFYNIHNIQDADIIVTTPEKFDAVTRYRIKDGGLSFFSDIALLLIDEVHLLNDPRGAALEAIVSRIKILACNSEMKLSPLAQVRFIAVSATIPNIEDLAEWLKVPVQGIKRFGEEMRPVKLTTKVFGYTAAKNDFLFEKRLQNYIFDILMQYSRGKSALVFCSTRKGAQEAAQRISQIAMTYGHSNPFVRNKEQQDRLREASLSCSDKQMQSYILYGVGYHNGGLCLKDRNLIEGLFLKGDLQVLCATNTLAHGINLPAHTVVIKSTQHFNKEKGLYMEYDRSMVLQMCGRAGRPPFDDTGMVIIMTRRETVHLYENLLNGCELVESQLLSCLTEHLTAEIVQLTISDITRAIEWMKCSYLYVRMKKNPANYSVRKGLSGDCIEKHIQEICVQKVNELTMNQMIWTDDDGFLLKPQEPGKLMTKYYLKFNTMKHIIQSPVNCNLEDALHIVCRAEELAWIQLRRNEKKLLNDINTDKDVRLRFHILDDKGKRKKRIQAKEEKMFVLANDCLTGDPLAHDLSLTQDTNSICSNGSRIAKCMKEYFIYKRNYKGALSSTLLAKSLHQKLWEDSPFLLKQLPGIGMVTAKALHSMGINSFETLAEADPRRIEMVTGRKYPFGNHIKESLNTLPPKVEIKIEEIESQRQRKSNLVVTLTRLSESIQSTKRHYADMVVGSEEDNLILFQEKIRVEEFNSPYSKTILLSNPIQGKLTIKADLIFEEHIGVDVHQTLSLIKEGNSNSDHQGRRSKQAYSCHPLEKVPITEKDNGTSNTAPANKEHRHSNKNKRVLGPMPSFNLLDEEFEEVTEVEPAIEIEDDDCKIISEQTIFDHIRKKAKNFPVLNAPNNSGLSPSEALTLIRKRSHEKQPEPLDEFDFLQEAEANTFPRQPAINQHDTSMYPTDHKQDLGNGRLRTVINLENDRENPVKALTEETVFDHIRRKSRNYPVINKSKMAEPELLFMEIDADSDKFLKDAIVISDPETEDPAKDAFAATNAKRRNAKHNPSPRSCQGPYGRLNPPSRTSAPNTDLSSMKMLSFDISMAKNSESTEPRRATGSTGKLQNCYVNGSEEQRCSQTMASKTGKVDSFLGFESIFSFL